MAATIEELRHAAQTGELPLGFLPMPEGVTPEECAQVSAVLDKLLQIPRLLVAHDGDVITFPCPESWHPEQMKHFNAAINKYIELTLGRGVKAMVVPHTCPMVVIRKESE